jgi:transposase-like protein
MTEKTERNQVIYDRLRGGETQAAVGRSLGITRERVRAIARKYGIARKQQYGPDKPYPPETIAVVRDFWDAGHSINEIGKRMGVTRNVIAGLAHRNNFPARPSPIRRSA